MKAMKLTAAVATAAVALAAFTGCATSEDTPSGDTPITVKYGIYDPGLDAGYLLMAQEKNLWEKYGVNVEVINFKSAAQAFPAFIAGEVDVIQANPSEALLLADKGGDIKFIGTTMPGLNYALYANGDIDSIGDLEGATLGASTPTALPAVVAKAMLMAEGIDPASVVDVKSGGSAERYLAVVNGIVDAAASPSDYVSRADADGVNVLGLAKDVIPDYPRYALITTAAFLEESPDGAVGLIAGLVEGIRYALDNEDEANKLTAKTLGGLEADDPSITSTYKEFKDGGYMSSNGEVPVKQIKYLAELQAELGISEKAIDVDPLVDTKYWQLAIDEIGEVAPTYYGSAK